MADINSDKLKCDISPRPLSYPLSDYHRAGIDGPLHYTWTDKPHRLLYDLIAAVRYYVENQSERNTMDKDTVLRLLKNHLELSVSLELAPHAPDKLEVSLFWRPEEGVPSELVTKANVTLPYVKPTFVERD